jgi:hypothetical protein
MADLGPAGWRRIPFGDQVISLSLNAPSTCVCVAVSLQVRSPLAVADWCIQKVRGLNAQKWPSTRRDEQAQRQHRWIQAKGVERGAAQPSMPSATRRPAA